MDPPDGQPGPGASGPATPTLFAIYADEVGHGDLRKNHITLIHRALASMDIRLPHIREAAFMEQGDLPDELYGFSLHQLCMALFPDTFYNEILGYNLAIEMFGLGELRLHEIQKLRHYGFDDCYEQAHLTIDNLSAGHSRAGRRHHRDLPGRGGPDAGRGGGAAGMAPGVARLRLAGLVRRARPAQARRRRG